MNRRVAFVAAALALVACHKDTPMSSAPLIDAATLAALTDAATASEPSQPTTFGNDASATDVRAIVLAWNQALDTHDIAALDHLYANKVKFYDRPLSKAAVLAVKRNALSAKSTFHQQILGDIAVTVDDDSESTATFKKHSGNLGKMGDVQAKIVVHAADGGALRIVEETDDVTAKRVVTAVCETESARVVNEIPAVKSNLADAKKAADASDGGQSVGGMGPNYDADGSFTVGLGTMSEERFEAEIWYTVDAAGQLSVTVLGADVPVPPTGLAAVAHACGH